MRAPRSLAVALLATALTASAAPAGGGLPSVQATSLTAAFSACYAAYAQNGRSDVYIDCVNAADLYFLGRGHHSRMYNA